MDERRRIIFIHGDDWIAAYEHGRLLTQGHSLDRHEFVKQLGMVPHSFEADQNWLEDQGEFPHFLPQCWDDDGNCLKDTDGDGNCPICASWKVRK